MHLIKFLLRNVYAENLNQIRQEGTASQGGKNKAIKYILEVSICWNDTGQMLSMYLDHKYFY